MRPTFIIVLFSLLAMGCSAGSLRKSENKIREDFFRSYSLGMPIGTFKEAVAAAKLEIYNAWDRPADGAISPSKEILKGKTVLMVGLGSYQGFTFKVDVVAYVGFTDGKLVDCFVQKQYDGP